MSTEQRWPLLQSHNLLLEASARQIEAAKAQYQQHLSLVFTELAQTNGVDPATVQGTLEIADGKAVFTVTPKEAASKRPGKSPRSAAPSGQE